MIYNLLKIAFLFFLKAFIIISANYIKDFTDDKCTVKTTGYETIEYKKEDKKKIDDKINKTHELNKYLDLAEIKKEIKEDLENKLDNIGSNKTESKAKPSKSLNPSKLSKKQNIKKTIKKSESISDNVLDLALKAYDKALQQNIVNNKTLTIIDFSKPSDHRRMWIIDMDKKKVDINTHVSHGVNSGGRFANSFSNIPESRKSSYGVMKTGKTYHGSQGLSLYLHGLEPGVNHNVFKRHVVIHGARYVNDSVAKIRKQVGRSFGCPAVDNKISKTIISKIKDGSLIFAYYPNKQWIKSSKFLS